MKRGVYICLLTLLTGFASIPVNAAGKAASLDALLQQVQQGKIHESKENKAREQEFTRNKARQNQMLADARKRRATEEARSARMERQFDDNELVIAEQTDLLTTRLG